jgi:hypothetical protein
MSVRWLVEVGRETVSEVRFVLECPWEVIGRSSCRRGC